MRCVLFSAGQVFVQRWNFGFSVARRSADDVGRTQYVLPCWNIDSRGIPLGAVFGDFLGESWESIDGFVFLGLDYVSQGGKNTGIQLLQKSLDFWKEREKSGFFDRIEPWGTQIGSPS